LEEAEVFWRGLLDWRDGWRGLGRLVVEVCCCEVVEPAVNLPILRTWFEATEVAAVELTGADPRRGLGGASALVVLVVCPAGLDDDMEDGTTVGLPRLALKGFDGAVNGLEVAETLEVGML